MDGTVQLDTNQLIKEFARRASAAGLNPKVMGDGSVNSEIAVVAEAPGEREVDKGVPLVGGSGRYLWDTLRQFGITRQHCYVTNVVKRQVSLSSKTDERDNVNKGELEHWEGLLDWELGQLPNVKYILALGNYALHAVTGEHGITNWRGSVLSHKLRSGREVKVIVSYKP